MKKFLGIGDVVCLHYDDREPAEATIVDIGVFMGDDGGHHMTVVFSDGEECPWAIVSNLIRSGDMYKKGKHEAAARWRPIWAEKQRKLAEQQAIDDKEELKKILPPDEWARRYPADN